MRVIDIPEYNSWKAMCRRCCSPEADAYPYYGGRGVKVCAEWRESFSVFLTDMGPRPSVDHSLDRIDVNGDYTPDNCRWADRQTQMRNTRTHHTNTSGRRGVSETPSGTWHAYIYSGQRKIRLGTHPTRGEAAAMRAAAEQRMWGFVNND